MNAVLAALLGTVDVLEAAGIEYAVTGSLAAAHHGYVRATEGVDIQVAVQDLDELEDASEHLPAHVRRLDAATWEFPPAVPVELYAVRSELDRLSMAGRERSQIAGQLDREVWVVPLEALLVLKVREHVRHGHGLKHIADVQELLARNHDRLDVERLKELLALDPAWEQAWEQWVETA